MRVTFWVRRPFPWDPFARWSGGKGRNFGWILVIEVVIFGSGQFALYFCCPPLGWKSVGSGTHSPFAFASSPHSQCFGAPSIVRIIASLLSHSVSLSPTNISFLFCSSTIHACGRLPPWAPSFCCSPLQHAIFLFLCSSTFTLTLADSISDWRPLYPVSWSQTTYFGGSRWIWQSPFPSPWGWWGHFFFLLVQPLGFWFDWGFEFCLLIRVWFCRLFPWFLLTVWNNQICYFIEI